MSEQVNVKLNLMANTAGLTNMSNQLDALIKKAEQLSDITPADLNTLTKFRDIYKESWNSLLGRQDLAKFNNDLKQSKISLTDYREAFNKIKEVNAFDSMAKSILTTNLQLKKSKTLLDELAQTMTNTVKWGITSSLFNTMTNSIQGAWNYAKALDGSLNDIRIVTGKSSDEMARFATQANKAAKSLGAATKDYSNASLIYYQQGLNEQDVQARAKTTLKTANVTGQTGEEVSEQLTAVWNGYKVNAQEAELYVDKLAAVAADTAADLEELSTGMSKVASAANLMGVDIDQLNAQLATIVSVTRQAPESVGTALKTIYARMGDIKAGLDGDVSLDEYTSQMRDMGVHVLNADGQLRDMGTVIEEIGSKWKTMSREQQISLSQVMAGTRQYNNLLSLFDNWEMYTKALETSKTAAGTLQKQQEIYMDSLGARLQTLSTEIERTYDIIFDEDKIKGFLSGITQATKLLNNLLNVTSKGALISGPLGSIGALGVGIFKSQIGQGIAKNIIDKNREKENAELGVLQQRLADIYTKKGINTEGSGLPKIAKIYQSIGSGLSNLSEEQQVEFYDSLGQILDITNRQDKLKNTDALKSIFNKTGKKQVTKEDLEKYITSYDKLVSANKEKQNELTQLRDSKKLTSEDKKAVDNEIRQEIAILKNTTKLPKPGEEGYEIAQRALNQQINDIYATRTARLEQKEKDKWTQEDLDLQKSITAQLDTQNKKIKSKEEHLAVVQEKLADINKFESTKEQDDRALKAHERTIESMDKESKLAEKISNELQAAASFTSLIQTSIGIINTFNNEDLTDTEKVEQISIGLGNIVIQSLALKKALHDLGGAKVIFSDLGKGITGIGKSLLKVITAHPVLTAIIGALVLIAGTVAYAVTKEERALAKLEERLARTTEVYNETKNAAEALKNTISNYKNAQDALLGLEKGTRAYKEAIIQANEKAMQLLQTNQELAKYATRNEEGLITISEEGLDSLLNKQLERTALAQIDYVNAYTETANASTALDIKNFRKNHTYTEANGGYWDIVLGKYGEGNINLKERGQYTQSDGSISTVNSMSFWSDEESKEILIPLINQVGDKWVELSEEEAIERYKQTGEYLGKFDNFTEANLYAQKLHEAQEAAITNQKSDYDFDTKISEELIQDIAQYMQDTNTRKLVGSDLYNIDSFKNASASLQQAIVDNIQPLEELANSINDTKTETELLSETQTQAYLQMKGFIDDDGKLTVEEIITNKIMNNAGGINVSKEAAERREQDRQFYEDGSINAFDENVVDKAIAAYEKTYGVKLKQGSGNKFLAGKTGTLAKYGIYTTDGTNSKTGELNIEEVIDSYYASEILEERAKSAKTDALDITKNINNLASQFNLADSEGLAKVLANSYIDENGNISINEDDSLISQEEAEQIFQQLTGTKIDKETLATTLGYAKENADEVYEEFKDYIKERKSISDNKVFAELGKKATGYATTLQDALLEGEINDAASLIKNEEYIKLSNSVDGLLKKYPELKAYAKDFKNEALAGTEQWAQAFYEIKDAAEELKIQGLNEELKELSDELFLDDENKEISLELAMQSDNFENQLDAILDKDYEISVAIHADAEDAFEAFEDSTESMAEQAEKISAGYVVAADDIRELNNTFPGIIDGMKAVGDGTVKLNKDVVQSAMSMAEAEMQASAQSTLTTLQNNANTLRSKQEIYQAMANAAFELAKTEVNAEQNKTKIKEGFDKLEAENDTVSTQTELNNAKNVADDSNNQARVTASNWTEAYQNAADSAVAFAQTAASAHQVAQTGDLSKLKKSDFNVTYVGQNAQSSEIAETAQLKSAYEAAASGSGDYYALGQAFQNAANALGKQANDIDGMIAQIGATSIETGYGLAGVAKGSGYDRKGSGKDLDRKDNLEDEKDIYHDINIILKQISTELDRLEKQEEKLVGQDLIDNLNEQWDRLQDTIGATNEKIKIARGEMSRLQGELGAKGVTFNPDGTIANYAAAYDQQLAAVNAVINHYNSLSAEGQEAYKDTVEQAEKNWEDFLDNISEYDELVSETIPELEDDIQAAIDEQIEIQIEKFNMEIELRLDMAEAERDWNEFKKRIIDDIEDDDILGNAQAKLLDYNSYYKPDGTGVIQKNTQHVNEIIEQLKSIEATGTSSIYGDNEAQALEDLKTYYEQLMSDLTDVHDLIDEIRESYLDMMDEAQDKFNEQVETYEYIRDLLTHDMDLITMVYGDEAYDKLVNFYEKQEDNYNKQLDFQRQQKDFWKAQMDSLEEGSDEWQKAKENWMSAVEEWNSLVEEAIENLQDKYLNAINNIFANLNDKVTDGLGLDYVEQEWDLINKNADQYLDTINAVFETQQLENKYLDAIDNTDNISAQRKLNDLMKEEIAALEQKDKLTQYDIDRANLKYEIALKQIALEEAQQTKSSMRLRRDSQGNYRYEFVADNDAIAEAEDELSVLQNQLYNMDVERYRENLDQLYEIYVEWQEALAEAAQINDPEARAERELMINEQYGELINGIVEENNVVRLNLYESAFTELSELYDKDLEEYTNLTQEEKNLLMEDLIPQWKSGVQEMANVFAGEGGFIPTCKDALTDLDSATKDYENDLVELQQQGGLTFNDIVAGENEAIYTAQGLLQANSALINTYQAELQAINGVIGQLQSLVTQYNAARDAANAAADAAYRYWAALNNQAASANTSNSYTPRSYGTSGSGSGGNGANANILNSGNGSGTTNNTSSKGKAKTGGPSQYQLTYILSNGQEQATVTFTASSAAEVRQKIASMNGINAFQIKNLTKGTSALGSYQTLSNFAFFKTGGYTGEWNSSEGRIGVLHQKELVLNQRDTENILGAVEIMRQMTNSIDNSIYSRVANFTSGIGIAAPELESGALEQNVHIEANFPNVQSSTEIEDAINNLVNIASQRATGTKK